MAGRIENLRLLPLSQDELANKGPAHFLDRLFAGDAFTPTVAEGDIVAGVVLYNGNEPLLFGDKMQALPLASLWSPRL